MDSSQLSEDDSEKLEDLRQELKDHTAAFNPENATEVEMTNFRRIRNAIYSRIKYRRRNQIIKKLLLQKADLERRNKSIQTSNERLEEHIKIATSITENYPSILPLLTPTPEQATPGSRPHGQQQIEKGLTALAHGGYSAKTNSSQSIGNDTDTLISALLSSRKMSAQKEQQQHPTYQPYSFQDSSPNALDVLSLLDNMIERRSNLNQPVSLSPQYRLSSDPTVGSFIHSSIQHHHESTTTNNNGNHNEYLHGGTRGPVAENSDNLFNILGMMNGYHPNQQGNDSLYRSTVQTILDLLSVEMVQIEINRRLLSRNPDPLVASVLQLSISKLLYFMDDLQRRCVYASPDVLDKDIQLIRSCIGWMKSLTTSQNCWSQSNTSL